MNIKYFIIYLLFTLIFLFSACNVNDSIENEYDQSVVENGVELFVKNGTLDTPGEIRIVNNSMRTIFIPFILHPYCNFSIYSLDKRIDTVWKGLSYVEDQDIWLYNRDSVIAVCQMSKNPVELGPLKTVVQTLSTVEETGDYQLKIYFRYSAVFDPNVSDKKMIIDYTVN